MIKKILGVVLFGLVTQLALAAENLYEKHYKPQSSAGLRSLQENPDTKMYVSNHQDEDNISMLENGYDMMGTSGFEAGDVPAELALQHAKSIKADMVLVYSKYASKKTSLSKIEAIKEAAKTTGEIDEKVLMQDDEQYKYFASYWVKLPMPLLGVHVIKLKPRSMDSEEAEAEKGLKVLAVIKDSPAAKANLLRGDVLLKIGDIELQKPEVLSKAAQQYQAKTVEITYERNGQPSVTTVTLNKR